MNTALNQHVLVLNRLWQAVNVCTARRALTLLFQGHAQVVLNDDDGSFRTFNFRRMARPFRKPRRTRNPSTPFPSASACRASSCCSFTTGCRKRRSSSRATTFLSATRTPANTAARVFDRKDLNLDHVIPRDRGGPTTWENIVCSCIECNTQQGQPHAAGGRPAPHPQTQAARNGGRSCRSTSACTGTTVGSTSLTSPTGTSNWAKTWNRDRL